MKKIDTTSWDEYYVGILFPDIKKPKVYHTREVVEDSAGIPYIVRSKFNNGIKYRIKPDGLTRSPKGVITFGAENAAFFYQEEEWCGGRDIYYIDTRNVPAYACKFLASCLNKITEKYTYSFGLFPDLLKKEKIKLPTKNGAPDWQYMEEYMRNIEQRVQSSVIALKDANYSRVSVNTSYWKPFPVESLFKVQKCSTKVGQKDTHKEGITPVYSSESMNNGIVGFCDLKPTWIIDTEHPLYLIFGDHTRTFHIADSSFCVADNVKVLLPLHKRMSIKVIQYISSVWQKAIPNLGYSRHWTVAKKVKILLPSNPAGDEPDWHYMEMYMRGVEAIVKNKLALLVPHKPEVALHDAANVTFNNANVTYIDNSKNYSLEK